MSSTATLAIRLTLDGATMAGRAMGTLSQSISRLPAALSSANQNLFFFLNNLKSIEGFIAKLGRGAFEQLIVPNINADQQVEALQFLVGSAEAARAKLRELFDVAGKADLPHEDVVKTYIALARLGDAALTTDESLLRIAKAAKFAGMSGADMATQFADAAVVLRSGKPFDRQALGLAKAGLISPETVQQLSEMAAKMGAVSTAQDNLAKAEAAYMDRDSMLAAQRKEKARDLKDARDALAAAQSNASGVSEASMWSLVNQEVDQHTRKVKDANTTWVDLAQRVKDIFTQVKTMAGAALFGAMKKDLEKIRDDLQAAFDDGRLQRWASAAGKALAELYAGIKDKSLFGLTVEDILSAAERGKLGELLGVALKDSAVNFWNAMLDLAQQHGPDILRSLFGTNTRLSKLLGLDSDQAMRNLAAGRGSKQDLDALGAGQMFSLKEYLGGQGLTGGGLPGGALRMRFGNVESVFGDAQKWAQGQIGQPGSTSRPMIDVHQDLQNRGLVGAREREMALKLLGGPGYETPAGALQSPGNYLAALRQSAAAGARGMAGDNPAWRKQQVEDLTKEIDKLAPALGQAADEAKRLVDMLRDGATF